MGTECWCLAASVRVGLCPGCAGGLCCAMAVPGVGPGWVGICQLWERMVLLPRAQRDLLGTFS